MSLALSIKSVPGFFVLKNIVSAHHRLQPVMFKGIGALSTLPLRSAQSGRPLDVLRPNELPEAVVWTQTRHCSHSYTVA